MQLAPTFLDVQTRGGGRTMSTRIYDVEALNRALPLVRSVSRDLRSHWTRLKQALRMLGLPSGPRDLEDPLILRQLPWDVRDLVDEYLSCVDELSELGLTLRDPETGLVEACGEQEGAFVFLSWRPGEKQVLYWLDPADPTGLRRPIHAVVG
jgi:hypothetical protein